MTDPESPSDRIAHLEAEVSRLRTEIEVLIAAGIHSGVDRDLFFDLFRQLGLHTVEGLPLLEWWAREKESHRQRVMILMEDKNPAGAAYLQSLLDRHTDNPT